MVKLFTRLLLGVFLFAITPFSIFHQHENQLVQVKEDHCTHKIHVTTQKDNCLVCKAHFEKNYLLNAEVWAIVTPVTTLNFLEYTVDAVDLDVPQTQHRGPPVLG